MKFGVFWDVAPCSQVEVEKPHIRRRENLKSHKFPSVYGIPRFITVFKTSQILKQFPIHVLKHCFFKIPFNKFYSIKFNLSIRILPSGKLKHSRYAMQATREEKL
jgi:hypothetical protein